MAVIANPPQGGTVGSVGPNARYVASNVPIGDYIVPAQGANPRYATSDTADHAFTDSPVGAWSPALRASVEGYPDPSRTGGVPLRQYYPDARSAPEKYYNSPGSPSREEHARHTATENVDADGWEMHRGLHYAAGKRAAPDGRRTPPPEPRLTQSMAPSSYSFTRPFDQEYARGLNGQHFSMADHRRTYEIYGMAPISSRRNTYRTDPAPWDSGIVDNVAPFNPVAARIVAVDVPDSSGRAWRL